MKKTRLMIVGGFLGAGKTTAIVALAKLLLQSGGRVAIVTNDQGSELVDTNYLMSLGLPVLEVTGGCFCCNFDEFTSRIVSMQKDEYPDYILAEPVGSCTDLVATIFKPLAMHFGEAFSVAPLSVLADPKRANRFVTADNRFPDEINYLFEKQLEEADIIPIGKCDTVPAERLESLKRQLSGRFPGSRVLTVSPRTGEGMPEWLRFLLNTGFDAGKASLDIDYDAYGTAEAALGWLNTVARVTSEAPIDGNEMVERLVDGISGALRDKGAEIAHLKCYLVGRHDFCKASRVSVFEPAVFDQRMSAYVTEANLVLNIRAAIGPDPLRELTLDKLRAVAEETGASLSGVETQCFSPSYPTPKYRER